MDRELIEKAKSELEETAKQTDNMNLQVELGLAVKQLGRVLTLSK